MKTLIAAVTLALTVPAALAADMTEDQKTLYAVGLFMGRQAAMFNFTPAEMEFVKKGLSDSVAGGKPAVNLEEYGPKIQQLAMQRHQAIADKAAADGKVQLEKAAKEKGAVKTASGLVYLSVKEGSGAQPKANDTVKVNYRGTTPDGKEFDSSYKRNEPAEFPLNGVIKCWTEGVAKMKVGGKAKLTCPAALAYGEQSPSPDIPPNSTLTFDVELLSVTPAPAPAKAPAAPAAPAKK
ncbi:MAG: FKBP-type peptidyl-prolyl cis-trans isomerase [Rhodocyclaceae bacterium]